MTVVVALIGLWIAFAQWWLGQKRLKMDLFDRRWAVYVAYRIAHTKVVNKFQFSPEDWHSFNQATAGAQWLFNKTVSSYLYDFANDADSIETQTFLVDSSAPYAEKVAQHQKRFEIRQELVRKQTEADALFAPFMHIDQPLFDWIAGNLNAIRSWMRSQRGRCL